MARRRERHPVMMIHGIASDGAWQDKVGATLEPFFKPVPVRYTHYRGKFGALKVICEPWLIGFAVVLGLFLAKFVLSLWAAIALASLISFLAFLPMGVHWRRAAALRAYMRQAGEYLDRAPNVIAHSFGTYLTVRLLETVKGVRLTRVVLCGCVLPRNYDWQCHVLKGRVRAVRNDFSNQDWVGLAAKLAGQLHSHLGNAGTHGFAEELRYVHRLYSPADICSSCRTRTEAHVHDVDCSGLGHSSSLLISSHCKMWWLPYFWGLDPAEHQQLIKFCNDWVHAQEIHDWGTIQALEARIHDEIWRWCHHETLYIHFKRAMTDHGLQACDKYVIQAINRFAHRVTQAAQADLNKLEARFLEPDLAVNDVAAGMVRAACRA